MEAYLHAPDSVIANSKVQDPKPKLSPLLQKQMTKLMYYKHCHAISLPSKTSTMAVIRA